ncbi:fungal trichothecene efflux pump [Xylariales sp. PMI_506]|nr:fungal trichothecene efflux pump [Xylariales sp. PMI_506]
MSSSGRSQSNVDLSDTKESPSQHVELPSEHTRDSLEQVPTTISEQNKNYLKVVHTDGTINYVDNNAVGGDVEGMPKGYFRSPQFIGTVVAQCLANVCAYLGFVLPSNVLSIINQELGPSTAINWVSTLWTLGSCIGFLLVGRISDIFGRRYMVLSMGVLGLIGCIIGALSQSVSMLIAASAFNGVAAASQLSFGIVLGELVPNTLRGPIVVLCFMSSAPVAIFGPIFARLMIQNTSAGWRWSFYIGIILSVIALVLYFFLYHPPTYSQLHVNGKTTRQQVKELDYIGIVLFIIGCVLFLVGLSWGGTVYPWTSAETLCTLLIGIATLVLFALYETFWCKGQPLMPPRLFKIPGYVAICGVAAIGAMVYYSLTLIWPTLIGTVYTTDTLQIGIQSSVVGGGIVAGQILGGTFIAWVPKVKVQTVIAACLSFAFMTSLVTLDKDHWASFITLSVLAMVSVGFIDNIAFPGVTLVIEPQDIGLATGVMGSLRALGGAVAQALYVSVLDNKLQNYLPDYATAAAVGAGLPESSVSDLLAGISTGNLTGVPGITSSIIAAVTDSETAAYTDAFKMVFYCAIPFSVIMIVGACFVPNMEKYLGDNVARKLQYPGSAKVAAKKAEAGEV